MSKKFDVNPKTGLPEISAEQRDELGSKAVKTIFIIPTIMILIGFAIAYAVHSFGDTTKYESRIALGKQYHL